MREFTRTIAAGFLSVLASLGVLWTAGPLAAAEKAADGDAAARLLSSASSVWRIGEQAAKPPAGRGEAKVDKAMTLVVRANLAKIDRSRDLVVWKDKAGKPAVQIEHAVRDASPWLIVRWMTDARPKPLELAAPLAAEDAAARRDIVLRYSGARLELFVDGVLVDEEWPLGSSLAAGPLVFAGDAPDTAFRGKIEHVALWDRALSDDDVLLLSGGSAGLAQRQRALLGPESPVGQYWRPRGHNVHVGDCMPFFHDGRFHLFYLFDRRHHGSKWGLGAHQWAHVSTTDLRQWEQHPLAVAITEPMEGSICTGSTFVHEGTYYAFYAIRMSDGSAAQLCAATSKDGIHFTKQPPLTTLKAPYVGGPGRDPVVFRDPDTGLFHMLVTTELANPPVPGRGGCLADLVSKDLRTWEQRGPFIVPGYPGQPECPDYFFWNGWYYLVFSNNGVARYRMARGPLGPWQRAKVDVFDGPQAAVMKTAAFTGGRRLGAAFLGAGGYGGTVVFREIIQHADGTLGTRWPAELTPDSCGPKHDLGRVPEFLMNTGRSTEPSKPGDGAAGNGRSLKVTANEGLRVVCTADMPSEYRLRARVRPAKSASYFGLRWTGTDKRGGHELRFEPMREKAGFRGVDAGSTDEAGHAAIYDVTGLDRPFDLDLIVRQDLVDLCIDGRRTLVARLSVQGKNLSLFAQNAEVTFEDIEVRPLRK